MNIILTYLPLLTQGIAITVSSWTCAAAISIVIGTCLGIISSYHVGSSYVINLIKVYTFISKGIPAYVHILIFYFVIPSFLPIKLSGFVSASLALAFSSSGYVTEIIRNSFNSIPRGQWEASFVLGYTIPQTIKRIIFPQALRSALAPLIGELEQLLKSTSLLATIGVTDITRAGMNIISRELDPLPVYSIIALIYLAFAALAHLAIIFLERRVHTRWSL